MSAKVQYQMRYGRLRLVCFAGLLLVGLAGVTLWFKDYRSPLALTSSMTDQTQASTNPGAPSSQHSPQQPEQKNSLQEDQADVRPLTTKQVFDLSARVVLARCHSVTTRRVNGGNIFTFSEFAITSVIKGPPGEVVTLRLLGGRIGNEEVRTDSLPTFKDQEEVVLFLGKENKDGYPTVFPQGVFRIRTEPVTQTKVVVPKPSGLQLFNSQGKPYSSAPESLPLEDFLLSLRKLK